jgi:hypothetical protein
MSWITYAEALNESPLRMRYDSLDRGVRYRVRVVYSGEPGPAEIRLAADGEEVHTWMRKPSPVRPVEFDVPRKATEDGRVTFEWRKTPGLGGNGRGLQVAEVWLLRISADTTP